MESCKLHLPGSLTKEGTASKSGLRTRKGEGSMSTLSPWTTWSGSPRAEEQKVAWECSPLGLRDGFAREQKAVLEYLWNEGVPQHGVDFLEVFAGHGGLTKAARRRGLLVGEPVDRLYRSYGRDWDLRKNSDRALLAWLISKVMKPKVLHVGAPCEKLSRFGEQTPSSEDLALAEFSCDLLSHQEKANGIGTLENPVGSLLFSLELFVKRFGTLVEPRRPWAWFGPTPVSTT